MAKGLMGIVQGQQIQRQRKRDDLINELYQGRLEDRERPTWQLVRDGRGGFQMVGVKKDGTIIEGMTKEGRPEQGHVYRGEDGSPYMISSDGTASKVELPEGQQWPTKRIPPKTVTDPNTGKKYQVTTGPDGRLNVDLKNPFFVPGETTDITTTTKNGFQTGTKTTKIGPGGKTTTVVESAQPEVEPVWQGGVEYRKETRTGEGGTITTTMVPTGKVSPSEQRAADKHVQSTTKHGWDKTKHEERGQLTPTQKTHTFNQLIKNLPDHEDATATSWWTGSSTADMAMQAQYRAQLDQIIELGKDLNQDVSLYEEMRAELPDAQGNVTPTIDTWMGEMDSLLNAINADSTVADTSARGGL